MRRTKLKGILKTARLLLDLPQLLQVAGSLGGGGLLISWALIWEALISLPLWLQSLFWFCVVLVLLPFIWLIIRIFVWGTASRHYVICYDNRKVLRSTGDIEGELEKATEVWACWHAGEIARSLEKDDLRKVKRLILRDPKNNDLEPLVSFTTDSKATLQEGISVIEQSTRMFQGIDVEVRWHNGPINNITILDPNSKDAWARIEPYLPIENAKWASYVLYKKRDKEAFNNIKDAFELMWNNKTWTRLAPNLGKEGS